MSTFFIDKNAKTDTKAMTRRERLLAARSKYTYTERLLNQTVPTPFPAVVSARSVKPKRVRSNPAKAAATRGDESNGEDVGTRKRARLDEFWTEQADGDVDVDVRSPPKRLKANVLADEYMQEPMSINPSDAELEQRKLWKAAVNWRVQRRIDSVRARLRVRPIPDAYRLDIEQFDSDSEEESSADDADAEQDGGDSEKAAKKKLTRFQSIDTDGRLTLMDRKRLRRKANKQRRLAARKASKARRKQMQHIDQFSKEADAELTELAERLKQRAVRRQSAGLTKRVIESLQPVPDSAPKLLRRASGKPVPERSTTLLSERFAHLKRVGLVEKTRSDKGFDAIEKKRKRPYRYRLKNSMKDLIPE